MRQNQHELLIGIMIFPGSQSAAVLGLTDLLMTASNKGEASAAELSKIKVLHLDVEAGFETPQIPFSALVIPPTLGTEIPGFTEDSRSRWLVEQHMRGSLICSVCAGAFILAQSGLLDGRTVTTHWDLAEKFSKRFSKIRIDTDKLLIDDGDIMTAGGLMAWVDLGLKLIERLVSPTIMLETARYFLVDPSGREQRFYSSFSPKFSHGDSAILKAQHWLQLSSNKKISIALLAKKSGLGERTFLRRFQLATELKPTQYLQLLRVGKAKEILEMTRSAVDEVAWQVGYEDPGAFRKIFKKFIGLSPREYRERFGVSQGSS